MAGDDEAKFNSSLKTSDYVRDWCIEVGVFLQSSANFTKAHHLLWMLNNEIHGWYCKKNSVDKYFKDLKALEEQADKAKVSQGTSLNLAVYQRVLMKWTRRVIEECYRIGWLAKENENIYDQDML